MSTGRLRERIPARRNRDTSHGGDGMDGSTFSTMRTAKRLHPARPWIGASSDTVTGNPSSVGAGTRGASSATGSVNGARTAWQYSRAMPRIENAYPRSGVTLTSAAES